MENFCYQYPQLPNLTPFSSACASLTSTLLPDLPISCPNPSSSAPSQICPDRPNASCGPQSFASTVEAFPALSDERRGSRRLARVC